MKEPLEFIRTGPDGTSFILNPTAVQLLTAETKPLVVVSVVGMYRTGKSYLLNRLMNRSDGFPLGATVQAKTKGIWMWLKDHPKDPTKSLLLLDTEGLHDPEKGSRGHDTWIFTLATLLSSVLVYNSKGAVDANALDGLYLASQLTEHVTVRKGNGDETGEEFGRLFPTLVWALRDHHLALEVDGKVLTPSEYLEHCLKLKKGRGNAVAKYNDLRSALKEFFVDRHMFCFPVPTNMDDLNNLDNIRQEDLDKRFIKVGDEFTNFILGQVKEKTLRGKPVNGGMFATLAKQYVEAIEKGNVNIESSFDYVLKGENTKAVDSALEFFSEKLGSLQLPISLEELTEECKKADGEANKMFLQRAILTTDEGRTFVNDLAEKMASIQKKIAEKNAQVSEENSTSILSELYKNIEIDLKKGKFAKSGGSKEYSKSLDKLEEDFKKKQFSLKKGPRGERVLVAFLKEKKENDLRNLIETDKALTNAEKHKQKLEMQRKQSEADQKALEKEVNDMQKAQNEMEKTFQANFIRQKAEFEEQSRKEQEALKTQFDALLENSKSTLEAGFKEEADLLKEQLADTKKRMQDMKTETDGGKEMMERMFTVMREQNEAHSREMQQLIANMPRGGGGGGCSIM